VKDETPQQVWIDRLDAEDVNFIRRFLLHSGSLKKIAAEYGVSYPTVRLRLDRLIQKIELLEENESMSQFERTLRLLLIERAIDAETFRILLDAHRAELETDT